MSRFGRRLRELRQEVGLTQAELSEHSWHPDYGGSVEVSGISDHERGKGPRKPQKRTVERLAWGLAANGGTYEYFLSELHKAANPEPLIHQFMERSTEHQRLSKPQDALPKEQVILLRPEEIRASMIGLIDSAAPHPSPESPILLARQSDDIFEEPSDDHERWRAALFGALKKGWTVVQAFRSDRSDNQLRMFSEDLPRFLPAKGIYIPRSFPDQSSQLPSYDIVYVPRRGAVMILATPGWESLWGGVFCPDQVDNYGRSLLDPIRAHVGALVDSASDILTMHAPGSLSFEVALEAAERHDGSRFLIMRGLSNITATDDIDKARSGLRIEHGADPQIVKNILRIRQLRRSHFERQVASFRFREICTQDAINKLMNGEEESGAWLERVTHDKRIPRNLSPEYRIKWLRNIKRILKYNNYELAIVNEAMISRIDRFAWIVKDNGGLFLGAWFSDDEVGSDYVEKNISTSDPLILEDYQRSFSDIWDSLPNHTKNKRVITKMLDDSIEFLKDSYRIR